MFFLTGWHKTALESPALDTYSFPNNNKATTAVHPPAFWYLSLSSANSSSLKKKV